MAVKVVWRQGLLVLADGSVFEGEVLAASQPGPGPDVPGQGVPGQGVPGQGVPGPARPAAGEVVFNTVMTGYQEVLTDPSYAGQVIAFTYPHIGNYGVAPDDDESRKPFCRGVIVRELTSRPSNWRAAETLPGFLSRHGLAAIAGIDTRRLTRWIRDAGAMPGAFGPVDGGTGAFDEASLLAAARAEPPTEGRDLVSEVSCTSPYRYGDGPFEVVAYDFGIKRNILRNLAAVASVTVVPASTPAEEVLSLGPDGVFLSNGPGDPAGVAGATDAVRDLLGEVPVFGICLGHQILAQALGGALTSSRSAITAATTPSGASRRARSRSPVRTTTTPWPQGPSRDGRRSATSTSTTASSRASCARTCPPSRSSTIPRLARGHMTPVTSSPSSPTSCVVTAPGAGRRVA